MTYDVQAAIALAAAQGPNMTEAAPMGGGDYQPPAEGPCFVRLVKYIELGVHTEEFKGQPKKREKVYLAFELHGPKHPLREDGTPHVIGFTETLSLVEKANFFKLFGRLNHDKSATHFAQLLGKGFRARVVHKVVGEGDSKRTYANLRDSDGYTISPPYAEVLNEETGDITSKLLKVPEAVGPLQLFLWNFATKEMWDSIFIDGEWEAKKNDKGEEVQASKSKNYFQNRIRAADNFKGSPIAELLFAGGTPDIPDAEAPPRTEADVQASAERAAGASADPLMEAA